MAPVPTSDPIAIHLVRPLAARMGVGPEAARPVVGAALLLAATNVAIGAMLSTRILSVPSAAMDVLVCALTLLLVLASLRNGEAFRARTGLGNALMRVACWGHTAFTFTLAGRIHQLGHDADMRLSFAFYLVQAMEILARLTALYLLLCGSPPPRRRREARRGRTAGAGG